MTDTRPILYRIANWSENFENGETRKLKTMKWIPLPTKQDGDGYTELMDHRNGAAHFGVWTALLQLASKCIERGLLMRGTGMPHTVESIARIIRVREAVITEAIERFIKIGWLEVLQEAPGKTGSPPDASGDGPRNPPLEERRGQDSTGEERRGERRGPAAPATPPPPSSTSGEAPPPPTTEDIAAANRLKLKGLLVEFDCTLEMAGKPIMHEWVAEMKIKGSEKSYPIPWIDYLFRVRGHRPKLPSDLRKILKQTRDDFTVWMAKRRAA